MQITEEIFKAYDIRGLVEGQVTVGLAQALGRAFATLLQHEAGKEHISLAVGRDMRPSSRMLQEAVMRGMQSVGAEVLDIGLVSTPAFYFGVGYTQADGGLMVSASHNPARYNGFKLTRANAVPMSDETGIKELARMIKEDELGSIVIQTLAIKKIDEVPAGHAEMEFAYSAIPSLPSRHIVFDSANGMGAQYLDLFLKRYPMKATKLFWEFDGTFPNHEADPFKPENRQAICAKVRELGADFGITTDGDGDRIFFIDNNGEVVEPAIIRGLVAQEMLRRYPGAKVVYDIRPGKITADMIAEAGGQAILSRVGHTFIKQAMIEHGAIYGGESSGHFYVRFPNGCYEGPLTTVIIVLHAVAQSGKTFAQLVAPLRRYAHSGEFNFTVRDKAAMIEKIKNRFHDGTLQTVDGISITYPNVWFNVRPSNTEPLLRFNVEGQTKEDMKKMVHELTEIVQAEEL